MAVSVIHRDGAVSAESGVARPILTGARAAEVMRAHYDLQNGLFISDLDEGPGWIRIFSAVSQSPIWNHAAWLGTRDNDWADFLHATRADWPEPTRRPTVYCVEEPSAADRLAASAGFQRFEQETWMCHDGSESPPQDTLEGFDIRLAETPGQIADFTSVFSAAYQVPAGPFNELLLRDLAARGDLTVVKHYIGYAGTEAVCSATLVGRPRLAGIYNVGTLPQARKRGFARRLLVRLIRDALQDGHACLFLQTEKGSSAERLYSSLGFEATIVRTGYRLAEWLSSDSSAPRKLYLSAIQRAESEAWAEEGAGCFEADCPPGLSVKAEAAAARVQIRPETLWLAAWAVLLSRYSQEAQISFGVRLGGEGLHHAQLEIDESQRIETWLGELDQWLDGRSRALADSSGREVESILDLRRRSRETNTRCESRCDLASRIPGTGMDRVQFEFDRDRFEARSIARLAGHWFQIVQGLIAQPNKSASSLELLTLEERQFLLACAHSGVEVLSEYQPIHSLFEIQAATQPEAPAVLVSSLSGSEKRARPVSYGELNRRADKLARKLRAAGAGGGRIVGVCMERSAAMISAVLAVFKTGAACLPLDPAYPAERLEFMLADADVSVVVGDAPSRCRLSLAGKRTVFLEDDAVDSSPTETHGALLRAPAASDSAYVIYTSGSSGKPKGVVIPHGAISRHCIEAAASYAVGPGVRVLQFNSLSFDAAFEQILTTLISGGTLVVRGPELWTPKDFGEQLDLWALTIVDLPTAFWHQVLEHWSQSRSAIPRHVPRLWIVGGEAMRPDSLRLWRALPLAGARLINAYGPTEATITATAFEVTREWLAKPLPKRIPIGRPRGARSVFVLDARGRLVPFGMPGELWIGGPRLAAGYLNRPDLTRQRFVPSPFASSPGERLYRTGDVVRFLTDGNLEFVGRADQQVKIRGYRVEVGEIEVVLCEYPAVQEAAVTLQEDQGRQRLAALVVPRKGSQVDERELRDFLRQRLPHYMIPSVFATLDAFPLLPGGKVDRQRLAFAVPPDSKNGGLGPRTPLELQLQLLFERILRARGIAIDASFFELGGDSLQALALIMEVERTVGRKLPLETLYQAPSVEALAGLLERSDSPVEPSALVPLQASGSRPPLVLMHTTPGDVLGYGNLVYHLGPEQPCYGIQSLGLIQPERSHQRIEEMAEYYTGLLRSRFSSGPYYLAGWCYGGIVAVEMARQLLAAGEAVGFVGLLETVAPPPSLRAFRYYLHRLGCFAHMTPVQWVRYFRRKAAYRRDVRIANRMRFRRLEASPAANPAMLEERNRRLARLEHVYRANLDALKVYRPRFYPGHLTLFNAAKLDEGVIPDALNAWAGLAASIEVYPVPGDHDSMLVEPNVSRLARDLQRALNRAQEGEARLRHGTTGGKPAKSFQSV